MSGKTILVPVDGASNIKLEALDFETLATVHSAATETPTAQWEGMAYNATGAESDWFDEAIRSLPEPYRTPAVVAPVARGASGGLIGADNTLMEVPRKRLTLSYTQAFGEAVEQRFRQLAGSQEEFFQETGSIRDFPGSLTLLKRFVFEQMVRPQLLEQAAGFAHYGVLLGGHFIGDDYLAAIRQAGNEHSYWMCHTGTRDVRGKPGMPSRATQQVPAFGKLVPQSPAVCYKPIGTMPATQAEELKLSTRPLVVPGGHDTCLSHTPILSTFYQAFSEAAGKPVLHVEAGTWTMIAQVAGTVDLPPDGYARDILIQGTVDGEPVVTARYGGGADFAHLKGLAQSRGRGFDNTWDVARLAAMLTESNCFVLPNISPANHHTGPFPDIQGRIINEQAFLGDGVTAYLASNLLTAMTTACQVGAVSQDTEVPIVLTAGGSKDPCFAALLATLTGRHVYALFDREGQAVTETTTLGAGIAGKAACLGIHPYEVDTSSLGAQCRRVEPLPDDLRGLLDAYRVKWMQQIEEG